MGLGLLVRKVRAVGHDLSPLRRKSPPQQRPSLRRWSCWPTIQMGWTSNEGPAVSSSRTLRVSSTRPCPGVGGHEWTPTHSLKLGCIAVLRCCTAQIGYPSDACAGDSSRASTGGCIPFVSVGVAAQTDLVVLVGLGVLAMFPVVQPESALQRLGHTGIVHPAGCCSKVSCRCDRPSEHYERVPCEMVADDQSRPGLALPGCHF
jgi:hypothetical protein